jgi:hypothetical protein
MRSKSWLKSKKYLVIIALVNISNVQNKISIYALDMVLQQLQVDVPLKDCTGSFNKVYGIPFRHVIDQKILQQDKLEVSKFSEQWRLIEAAECDTISKDFEEQLRRIQKIVKDGGSNTERIIAVQLEKIARNSNISDLTMNISGRSRPVKSKNLLR